MEGVGIPRKPLADATAAHVNSGITARRMRNRKIIEDSEDGSLTGQSVNKVEVGDDEDIKPLFAGNNDRDIKAEPNNDEDVKPLFARNSRLVINPAFFGNGEIIVIDDDDDGDVVGNPEIDSADVEPDEHVLSINTAVRPPKKKRQRRDSNTVQLGLNGKGESEDEERDWSDITPFMKHYGLPSHARTLTEFSTRLDHFAKPFIVFDESHHVEPAARVAAVLAEIPEDTQWIRGLIPQFEKLQGKHVVLVLGMCLRKAIHADIDSVSLESPFTEKLLAALKHEMGVEFLLNDLRKECWRTPTDEGCMQIKGDELDRLAWATKLELLVAQECYDITFDLIWEFSACWNEADAKVFDIGLQCLKDPTVPRRWTDWHISLVSAVRCRMESTARRVLLLDLLTTLHGSKARALQAYPVVREFLAEYSRIKPPAVGHTPVPIAPGNEAYDYIAVEMKSRISPPPPKQTKRYKHQCKHFATCEYETNRSDHLKLHELTCIGKLSKASKKSATTTTKMFKCVNYDSCGYQSDREAHIEAHEPTCDGAFTMKGKPIGFTRPALYCKNHSTCNFSTDLVNSLINHELQCDGKPSVHFKSYEKPTLYCEKFATCGYSVDVPASLRVHEEKCDGRPSRGISNGRSIHTRFLTEEEAKKPMLYCKNFEKCGYSVGVPASLRGHELICDGKPARGYSNLRATHKIPTKATDASSAGSRAMFAFLVDDDTE